LLARLNALSVISCGLWFHYAQFIN
jgi:hypothetical protein